MSNISFVLAADSKQRRYVNNAEKLVRSFGYECLLYDLGGLGRGIDMPLPTANEMYKNFPGKPSVILDACNRTSSEYVVWLDADTWLLDTIDEIAGDYDIGVTVRSDPGGDESRGSLNSGVIFVHNTPAATAFLATWCARSLSLGGDQRALNGMCMFPPGMVGQCILSHGAQVKGFPGDVYNNYRFDTPQAGAKILHYKSDHRRLLEARLKAS
jgi:hypothetical protein